MHPFFDVNDLNFEPGHCTIHLSGYSEQNASFDQMGSKPHILERHTRATESRAKNFLATSCSEYST
jgi:hypothetical protein